MIIWSESIGHYNDCPSWYLEVPKFPCHCKEKKMIENKADKFLFWLSEETDYGDWHPNVKGEIRHRLIEILSEPEPE